VRGGVPENDERISADHLAVENARAVKASSLDACDERHQVRHRRGAGNTDVNANGFGHAGLLVLIYWEGLCNHRFPSPKLIFRISHPLRHTVLRRPS